MSKGAVITLILAALIIVGGIYLYTRGDEPNNTDNNTSATTTSSNSWLTTSDTDLGVSYQYPTDLGTEYIDAVDWPPQIQLSNTRYSCNQAGTTTDRAGGTRQISLGGRVYCITQVTEGAAGSIYNQYAYAFANGTGTAVVTFTTREVQCANFDEPERSECQEERDKFDINDIMSRVLDTFNVTNIEPRSSSLGSWFS